MAERNLNIQKVKDNTTLSRTTISNLYNNYGSGIQYDTLGQLCALLNCQPGDLFTYYDVSVNFNIINNNDSKFELGLAPIYERYREDDNLDQSQNKAKINIHCEIEYQGEFSEFDILVNIHFWFETRGNIKIEGVIPKVFETKTDILNLPFIVESHIKDQLDEFITNSICDVIYTELDGWGGIHSYFDIRIEQ